MTILAELREEIQEIARRSPTKTLLWLDPQREWERLLDQLATELELVKYAGSQLELRMKIEVEPAQKPRFVYVPLARQVLSALKEYEFTLPVWDEGLLHALRRWGVGIDRDEEKVLLPLLPNLAGRWSDKSMDYWRHLTASGVRARLFDDEQILVFLADPDGVVADLERDGALAVFRDYLAEAFGWRVVRKDLVKKTKVGFNVPVYVLEYLLGQYCSSTDPSIVAEGLEHVKSIVAERFVRADEGELIKSRTRERGSMRLIDKVTVTYRETEDKYWASLANSGLSYVHIAPHLVQQYEKLLVGGIWGQCGGPLRR